jgi:hypothetical protein
MTVGVFIERETVWQPDDFGHPELSNELRLDCVLRHRRIAIRVEQALFGGCEESLAVRGDGSTLQHHVNVANFMTRMCRPATCDFNVGVDR